VVGSCYCMVDCMVRLCMVDCMMGSCCMVDCMVWCCCMMDNMMRDVMVDCVMWVWQRISIFIQLWFRIVRVVSWVSVQTVERWSLTTVNLVPIFTGELILVKQCPVWTEEACSMWTVSTVIAYSVSLTT